MLRPRRVDRILAFEEGSESGFDVSVGKKREDRALRMVGSENSAWECVTGLKRWNGEAWDLGSIV